MAGRTAPAVARTGYGLIGLISTLVLVAMFTPIGWLAYLQDPANTQWLVVGIAMPLVGAYFVVAMLRSELVVTADGVLRVRSPARSAEVDLARLRTVELSPPKPYDDTAQLGKPGDATFTLTDGDGRSVSFSGSRPGQWRDPRPIAAEVIAALLRTRARCTPRCWMWFHTSAGMEVPSVPAHLTAPPADGWGRPIGLSRPGRTAIMIGRASLPTLPLGAG